MTATRVHYEAVCATPSPIVCDDLPLRTDDGDRAACAAERHSQQTGHDARVDEHTVRTVVETYRPALSSARV